MTTINCSISDFFTSCTERLNFITFTAFLPIYFVLGIFGNVLILAAFCKQAKTERAYYYQIFLSLSQILQTLSLSCFWFCIKIHSGADRPGSTWFTRRYALMFYTAYIGLPLSNGFVFVTLFLSVAMTADRVLALAKPFWHRNINHRRHQQIALWTCIILGLVLNALDGQRLALFETSEKSVYKVGSNPEFQTSPIFVTLGHLRTIVRLVTLIGLIVLSAILVARFRAKVAHIPGDQLAQKRELERKAAERSLTALTKCQSCLTILAHIPHTAYFVIIYFWPMTERCYATLMTAIVDLCICIAGSLDFVVVLAANRKIRRTVLGMMPRVKNTSNSTNVIQLM